jgi:hypothetical protein
MASIHLQNVGVLFGGIAQWLEQRTHNPLVLGSSPSTPTSKTVPIYWGFFIG